MTGQGSKNNKNLNLVCDFPARESFRESLLAHLEDVVANLDNDGQPEQPEPKAIHLDDNDLNALAAAEDDTRPPVDPFSQQ